MTLAALLTPLLLILVCATPRDYGNVWLTRGMCATKCLSMLAIGWAFQDAFYLLPLKRRNQHWLMLLEVENPTDKNDMRVFKIHLNMQEGPGGMEVSRIKPRSYIKNPVLNDDCGKVKDVNVAITFFQYLERLVRYRVAIEPVRFLYSVNHIPVNGTNDYICQDIPMIANGAFCGGDRDSDEPHEGWFKHSDDFTREFLVNGYDYRVRMRYAFLIKQNPRAPSRSPPTPKSEPTEVKINCDLGDIDDDASPWNGVAIMLWLAFLATLSLFLVGVRCFWKQRESTEESPDDDDLEVGFDRRRKESDSRAGRSEKSEPGSDQGE